MKKVLEKLFVQVINRSAVLRDTPPAYFSLLTQDSHPAELE